jgi:hypothetical protein
MAKIINFFSQRDRSLDLDFLSDENQIFLLPSSPLNTSAGTAADRTPFRPDFQRDWNNQELADLFRVRELLVKANIAVGSDRGVTDEGDPWFVFCDGFGEVVIHLCRIDGVYILDNPNITRPLRGTDFASLITDFTNLSIVTNTDCDVNKDHRVIQFTPTSKVRLHPSAMLAALIWTLLLKSEELVFLTSQDNDISDANISSKSDHDAALGSGEVYPATSIPDTDLSITTKGQYIAAQKSVLVNAAGPGRDLSSHQHNQTTQQNCISLSLTTIAIAMGLAPERTVFNDRNIVIPKSSPTDHEEQASETEDAENIMAAGIGVHDFETVVFSGVDSMKQVERPETFAAETDVTLYEMTNLNSIPQVEDLTPLSKYLPLFVTPAHIARLYGDVIDEDEQYAPQRGGHSTSRETGSSADGELLVDSSQVTSVPSTPSTTVELTPDVSEEEFLLDILDKADFNIIENTEEYATDLRVHQFEGLKERLAEFFQEKGGDVGFIYESNGFLAVDREAVKSGDVEYITWQTDSGRVVSFIGHSSDFKYLDAIA